MLETGCDYVGGINEDQVRQIIPCEQDIERFCFITERKVLGYWSDYWSRLSDSCNDAVQW